MSTFEFVSSIINSLAWPIVILTIIILLRKAIVNLLSNLSRVTYNNLEMEFAQTLEKLETSLETKVPPSNLQSPRDNEIASVAQISPAASIILAWSMVEQELMSTIKRLAISPDYPPYNSPLKNIGLLKDAGLIDSETEKTLGELRDIRNKAVHGHISDAHISYFDAMKYYDLSKRVTELLRNLRR